MRLQWPSKQVEDLASFPGLLVATERGYGRRAKSGTSYVFCPNRDKAQHSGTVPAIPGRLATMLIASSHLQTRGLGTRLACFAYPGSGFGTSGGSMAR